MFLDFVLRIVATCFTVYYFTIVGLFLKVVLVVYGSGFSVILFFWLWNVSWYVSYDVSSRRAVCRKVDVRRVIIVERGVRVSRGRIDFFEFWRMGLWF